MKPLLPWVSPVLCLLLPLLAGCTRAPRATSERASPEVRLWGVHMESYRGASRAAFGNASQLNYGRDKADVAAHLVTVSFLLDGGASQVRAVWMTGNLNAHGVDASGGVEARSPSGLVGRTERGHLETESLIASGTAPLEIKGPANATRAQTGFSFDLRNEEYDFFGPVVTRFGGTHNP